MLKKSVFTSVVLILFFSFAVKNSFAQSQKGISVTPSIIHLDLASDPAEYALTYTNNTDSDINLLLSVKDFTELEDSYRLSFLEGKDAANYKYSLSSWISFENKNIQLSPNESKTIKVFIDKNRITKGGHYASVLAEIIQPKTDKQVVIKAVLSSLLFVRASTGNEIEDGKILSFKPSRDGVDNPESFSLRFQNNGNVHVVPYGIVKIKDIFGNQIAKGILNENSLDALPESIRRYEINIKRDSNFLIPGFYTAELNLHFGKSDTNLNAKVTYFTQGSINFIVVISVIVIVSIIAYLVKKRRN